MDLYAEMRNRINLLKNTIPDSEIMQVANYLHQSLPILMKASQDMDTALDISQATVGQVFQLQSNKLVTWKEVIQDVTSEIYELVKELDAMIEGFNQTDSELDTAMEGFKPQ